MTAACALAGAWLSSRCSSRMGGSCARVMEAPFIDNAAFIDECVSACGPADGQVGAAFAIGGAVVGFDLFDSPVVLRKLLLKLVRAVAVDALDAAAAPPPTVGSVERFLAAVAKASVHETAAVGMGIDLRLSAVELTGTSLLDQGRVVHLSAFVV